MDALKKNTAAVVESTANDVDPFTDLSNLRLNQNFVELAGAKKLLTTVWVRKPPKQDWVRVHPDEAYRGNFAFIELKDDDREHYLVMPNIVEAVLPEIVMKTVYTTINRQGVVFLWPVSLPTDGVKYNEWHRSAREGAEKAMSRWMRIVPNKSLGANELHEAPVQTGDPVWPEHAFLDLLRIAFRDKLVQDLNHPVLKRLRGEM